MLDQLFEEYYVEIDEKGSGWNDRGMNYQIHIISGLKALFSEILGFPQSHKKCGHESKSSIKTVNCYFLLLGVHTYFENYDQQKMLRLGIQWICVLLSSFWKTYFCFNKY